MSPERPSFSDIILGCLDRALNIVGGTGKQVVYEALENRYGIGRDQIPEHPDYLLKTMKVYLGSAADAVEKEMLIWIKEASGVDEDNLIEAMERLRQEYAAEASRPKTEAQPVTRPKWQLESQSNVPEVTGEADGPAYRYSAKFSFGMPQQKKQDDPDSREALEAYLRSIVEKHTHEKERKRIE